MLARRLLNHPRRTVLTSTLIVSTAVFIKRYPFKSVATYATVSSTMKITPIPMFSVIPTFVDDVNHQDNYAYLVTDPASKESAIVDPAEPKRYCARRPRIYCSVLPVLKKMIDSGEINLTSIITTHHHGDHAGGNKEIVGFLVK
jgi:hydroxyacylglutathione hydrolase